MSAALVRKVSLQNHLALVALRQGHGNLDLAGELLKTVFVAFYLVDRDCLATHARGFAAADESIRALIKRAVLDHAWRLDASSCEDIERILGLHDAQLAGLPVHWIEGAKRRVIRALDEGSFPNLSASPN